MRPGLCILFVVLAGCHKEPGLSVEPSQLVGTWNSLSTSVLPTEKPITRWTFTTEYLYIVGDTVNACQPVDGNTNYNHPYKYKIEDNTLVMRYVGFTTGLVPIPDIRWRISSITTSEVVLDKPRLVLETCP